MDQYGLRDAFKVDGVAVKFEIIFEGRVALADPLPDERICGVWTLRMEDRVATKLMANSDRWADDSVMSRDLIDLAMLTDSAILDPSGVAKAVNAYGESVLLDLERARQHLLGRPGRLAACIKNLKITIPPEELGPRIAGLRAEVNSRAARRRAPGPG